MVFAYFKPTNIKKPTTHEQLTDLSGCRVGTTIGSNTIPSLQDAGIDVSETSIESQIKMLKGNRIDFAAVGFLTGLDSIAKLYPGHADDFAFIRKPTMELPTSIYFNKRFPKSDDYAEQFRTELTAIIKIGSLCIRAETQGWRPSACRWRCTGCRSLRSRPHPGQRRCHPF